MVKKKGTFCPDIIISGLADNLRKDYEKLSPSLFHGNNFSEPITIEKDRTLYPLEKDRYTKNGDKNNKGDEIFIPRIEISNKMYNSPILFIGMNPSGADYDHYKAYCMHHKKDAIPDVFIYCGDSPYYETMEKFASECLEETVEEDNVSHKYSELDLFGIVQSTQTVIQEHFLQDPQPYIAMFDLFLKYVKKINPKVIIVANAFVRKILLRDKNLKLDAPAYKDFYGDNRKSKFKIEEKVNDNYGGHTFTINTEGGCYTTQLYFSSMLSGQRALDLGSRENLVWLVRNYLKNNQK